MNNESKKTNTEKNTNNQDPLGKNNGNNGKKPGFNFYWIYGILAVIFIAVSFFNWDKSIIETSQQQFENEMLKDGDVEKVTIINQELVEVVIKVSSLHKEKYDDIKKKGINEKGPHYVFTIGSVDNFESIVRDYNKTVEKVNQVNIFHEKRKNWSGDIFSWLIPIGLLIVFWVFILRWWCRRANVQYW